MSAHELNFKAKPFSHAKIISNAFLQNFLGNLKEDVFNFVNELILIDPSITILIMQRVIFCNQKCI